MYFYQYFSYCLLYSQAYSSLYPISTRVRKKLSCHNSFCFIIRYMFDRTMLTGLDPRDYLQMIEKYGKPDRLSFAADFLDFECELVQRSAAKGRNHDITCFIRKGSEFIVIQKHDYAGTGIYRAPSGGAYPGESIEEAALREMYEETGTEVKLKEFVLDLSLNVRCSSGLIPWRSLVFLADYVAGELNPIDTYEIAEVTTMTRKQLLEEVNELMKQSGWGGFAYRAFLTKSFFERYDGSF
ncbi:MAG: NUDIX domain-containing protein [Candidatus Lokiarchaeota archaeon]|nr:NUDIX domain-containing protein [Candidatus Lokiarchaeota archaeon]